MAFAVVTRDVAAAAAYAAALAPLGLETVAMPVTKTAAAADSEALRRALETEYAAVVVASPRAAYELHRAAAGRELPEVWAVGPATQRALEIAKIAAHQPDGAYDSGELARRLVAARAIAGRRVLVLRAEEGRTEAVEVLRAGGADVVDVIAYRTVAVDAGDPQLVRGRELLESGRAAVCALFAPSQVTALAALVGPLTVLATRYAAIGDTTASALRAVGVSEVAIAATPTPEGIARAVAAVYPPR